MLDFLAAWSPLLVINVYAFGAQAVLLLVGGAAIKWSLGGSWATLSMEQRRRVAAGGEAGEAGR